MRLSINYVFIKYTLALVIFVLQVAINKNEKYCYLFIYFLNILFQLMFILFQIMFFMLIVS